MEVTLNNRPLCYVEDDVQLPILTPSAMMFGQPKLIPNEDLDEEDSDMKKRAKYLRRCKDVLWSHWTGEYLKSLRERQPKAQNQGDGRSAGGRGAYSEP